MVLGNCLLRGWTVLPSLEVSNARLLGLFCVECHGGCRSLLGLGGKAGRPPLLSSGRAHVPASCSSAAPILGELKMFSNVSLVPCLICISWTYGVLASPCWIFLSECMAGKSSTETSVCDLFFGEGVLGGDGGGDALDFFYLRTGSLVRLSRLVFRGPWGTCRRLCIFGLTVFFVCDRLEAIFISQGMGQLLFCHAPNAAWACDDRPPAVLCGTCAVELCIWEGPALGAEDCVWLGWDLPNLARTAIVPLYG